MEQSPAMSTVHYALGWLKGIDWGGEPIKRASMACGSWFDQEVPYTEDVEEVTCEKCLERMAEQTEATLRPTNRPKRKRRHGRDLW